MKRSSFIKRLLIVPVAAAISLDLVFGKVERLGGVDHEKHFRSMSKIITAKRPMPYPLDMILDRIKADKGTSLS